MSTARQHADWLSLVEVSGPFLSMPVLMEVFPQGLDQRNPEKAAELNLAYDEWGEGPDAPGRHRAWLDYVLLELLEFPANTVTEGQALPPGLEAVMPEYGEVLRPDLAILGPAGTPTAGKPQLLVQNYPESQELDSPVSGKHWKASPATRMTELLHASGVVLGLVTNGEQWMLVYAPRGETSGYASWYAHLWQEEPITLRAFHSLLHCRRFFGVAEDHTLTALLKKSAQDQQEVTDQLGYQVRRAVEVLVQALDKLNQESNRKLLTGTPGQTLYDGALTVMMRLVFLFAAEERGLLRLGEPLYDENYAVSTLREQLREVADQFGEEVLERRSDAWGRLLASFRAVHGGVEHEAMRLPAYGGTLFDPDRYPFLEGRAASTTWREVQANPLAVNNRVVLHLLESLQLLQVKVPGGGPAEARRLSFKALDIEQIGHVYEGLLDHTAVAAKTLVLGLRGTREQEPEVPIDMLEELGARGTDALVEFLKEESGRSESAIRKALAPEEASLDKKGRAVERFSDHELLIACGQDPRLLKRLKPFAGLIRADDFGQPVVIQDGSVYVTAGTTRRSTGTHYTPRSLTQPIVQHTLEPLVYIGPAEGLSRDQWKLRTPREILALKICDMAMGSAAFLVETCRYLAERLVEAWENAEKANPGKILATPEGDFSAADPKERLIPKDPTERLAIARRYVADRCLYGVDINEMAVEMAKLSIWLVTLQRDRPFTFLDHALKCGDSLLGVNALPEIEKFSLRPGERQVTFATANLFRYVEQAGHKRRELEDLPSNYHTQIESKNRLHAEAQVATAKVKALADCLIAFELRGLDGQTYEDSRETEAENAQRLLKGDANAVLKSPNSQSSLLAHAQEQLRGRHPFHWPVEFPEVFARGGFDAFVGNPPFMGGTRISTVNGSDYLNFLGRRWPSFRGRADLCSLFFLRGQETLRLGGCFGLIATNTIAQGDTREAGLDVIVQRQSKIYRAVSSMQWPGHAGLAVSVVHVAKGAGFALQPVLDGAEVDSISAFLNPSVRDASVYRLNASLNRCFAGSKLDGIGFVISQGEANELHRQNPKSADVLFPYLNGDDVTSQPDQKASRYVINFFEWEEKEARRYPECFGIVEERVYPERQHHSEARTRANWWRFQRVRPELYLAIARSSRVLVVPRVSKFLLAAFVDAKFVFSDALNVVASDDASFFSVLQSDIHESWARIRGSTLETRLRYTPTDCFETFPFPCSLNELSQIGERYHELRFGIMGARQEGLTKTYNRFHDRSEVSADIVRLRALHVEMNQAVATAYGWSDLDLSHGFHATKQGVRYTISEPTRLTILDRLQALNNRRYDEEVEAGLHDKGVKKGKAKRSRATAGQQAQSELLPSPQQDLFT